MKARFFHALIIIIAGVILTLPLFVDGFPFYSHDGKYHVLWHKYFSEQFWQGEFYPRWLSGMNGGLGSPVFFFYPPVPYFISSIFALFVIGDSVGWHQLGFSASLALIGSGLSAYCWLQKTVHKNASLLAAILYMALPYHLAIDLYIRGALGELWALVWLPLILYFVKRTAENHLPAAVGLTIVYALLIMTHLPTALIFSLIPVGYATILSEKQQRKKNLILIFTAMLVGIGLSAVYLAPALTMQEFVSMREMRTGHFDYQQGFFSAESIWHVSSTTRVLIGTVLTISLTACFFFVNFSSDNQAKRERLFWSAIILLCFFMMTPLSKFIWQITPPLQNIQFPWRFNILIVPATALLAAVAFQTENLYRRKNVLIFSIAGAIFLCCLSLTAYFAWKSYPATQPVANETAKITRNLQLKRDAREYKPVWVTELKEEGLENLLKKLMAPNGELAKARIIQGVGELNVIDWKSRNITLLVNGENEMTIEVSQFYFPGWTAKIDDEPGYLNVQPSADGLLSFSVPSGNHRTSLRLEKTKPEMMGQFISLISFAVLILASLALLILRRHE